MLENFLRILPFFILILEPVVGWTKLFSLEPQATLTFFMMMWMVLWWATEIMPMGITALIPMVFLPLFQIMPLKEVSANYANPVIYLFLGGFIIARALEKTKLNERIALKILTFTGRSDRGIVLGFMIATAFLSMWISNTATTVMMVPIALAVIDFLQRNLTAEAQETLQPFSLVILLSLAYSANIGGIATPIGTPPNVVLIGYLDELFQIKVDFWRWMLMAIPVVLVLSALQFLLLTKLYKFKVPIDSSFISFIKEKSLSLGPLVSEQKLTIVIFVMTCSLWVTKGLIHTLIGFSFLNDTSIAILGGLLLFLIPANKKQYQPVLSSHDISHLPWNIVLLFGGGMAMADSLRDAGLIEMTTQYLSGLDISSPYVLVFLLATVALFLTEIMSNVALCVVALPVMMKLGQAYGLEPIYVGLPVALCASFAFSLPISTPPNAIVFGTNRIHVPDMLRAGLLLNVLGIAVVMTIGWWLMQLLL